MKLLVFVLAALSTAMAQVPCTVVLGKMYDDTGKLVDRKIAIEDCDRDVQVNTDSVTFAVKEDGKRVSYTYPYWYYMDLKIIREEPVGWFVDVWFSTKVLCPEVTVAPSDTSCRTNYLHLYFKDRRDIRFTQAGLYLGMWTTFKAPDLFYPYTAIEKVTVTRSDW